MACLAAARLNAAGYSFDLEKIIGFALDSEGQPACGGQCQPLFLRTYAGRSAEQARLDT